MALLHVERLPNRGMPSELFCAKLDVSIVAAYLSNSCANLVQTLAEFARIVVVA